MKLLTNKSAQKPVVQPEISSPSSRKVRRPRRTILVILAVPVILLVAAGGYLLFRPQVQPLSLPVVPSHLTAADLGLAQWREYQSPLPANPLTNPQLPETPRVASSLALLEDAAGQALVQHGQLTRGLAYLRAAAQSDSENLRYSNDYRLALRDHELYTEEFSFFSQLAHQDSSSNPLINFALVYVDQMRACPVPPDGLVCQAQDSWNSINILNDVLTQHPYNILARFARGLNHLYWPNLMGHLPLAQTDLQYAVALTRSPSIISQAFIPQVYTALGDVFAKDGKGDQARNVWLNGEAIAVNSSLLKARLSIPADQLVNAENGPLRGLGVYVDTDLAVFWKLGR